MISKSEHNVSQTLGVRLSPKTVNRLEEYRLRVVKKTGRQLTRSELVRLLVERHLDIADPKFGRFEVPISPHLILETRVELLERAVADLQAAAMTQATATT